MVGLILMGVVLVSYRITVSLVADQDAAEVFAVEGLEERAKVIISHERSGQTNSTPCLKPIPRAATLANMRRRVAFVAAALAVFAALGSVGLAYGPIANPRPPQQPGNLECDNNYSIASDPVCVAAFKYERDPVGASSDRHLPNVLLLIVVSLVLPSVAVRLFRGSHSGTTNPMMAQGP